MATTSPLQAVPLPQNTDPDNVPADLSNAVNALESRGVMRFASAAARSSAITAPIAGMVTYLADVRRHETYNNGTWERMTDRPEAVTTRAWAINRVNGGALVSGVGSAETVISSTYYQMPSISMLAGHYYKVEAEVDGFTTAQDTAVTLRIRKTTSAGYMVREKTVSPPQGQTQGRWCTTISGIYYSASAVVDTFLVTVDRAWGTGTITVGTYPNPSNNNWTWMLVQDLGASTGSGGPWQTLA
jgi:hypothetical protein